MYLDAAALASCNNWTNKEAERQLAPWKLNRLKLAKIKEHMQNCEGKGSDVSNVPQEFMTGRYNAGLLGEAQKKDLHTHITLCSMSNRTLTIPEVKQCMLKYVLWNTGVLTEKQLKEQDAPVTLEAYEE